MRVEVQLDSACSEPRIIIVAAAMTEEVQALAQRLSDAAPAVLAGVRDGKAEVLEYDALIRVYASAGKVMAETEKGEYVLRFRLYELEERLDPRRFVRISNSEIINLRQVRSFDLSLTGTVCVKLMNGATTYVSRRHVAKVKKLLGL